MTMMDDEYLDLDTKNGEHSDYQDIPWSHDDVYEMHTWDRIWLGIALLVATTFVVLAAIW